MLIDGVMSFHIVALCEKLWITGHFCHNARELLQIITENASLITDVLIRISSWKLGSSEWDWKSQNRRKPQNNSTNLREINSSHYGFRLPLVLMNCWTPRCRFRFSPWRCRVDVSNQVFSLIISLLSFTQIVRLFDNRWYNLSRFASQLNAMINDRPSRECFHKNSTFILRSSNYHRIDLDSKVICIDAETTK